jgi:phosphoenolpyruvate carboxylase
MNHVTLALWLDELLSRFPALWLVIGGVTVGVIAFLIARKAFNLSAAAQDRLVKILEESNKALEKERDDYRQNLHGSRERCQATELKLKEAEARPDLTKLFEAQQKEADRRYEVYTLQTDLIARQSEVLASVASSQVSLMKDFASHEKDNAERHAAMMKCLDHILKITRLQRKRAPKLKVDSV